MYIFDWMIENTKVEWTSPAHRELAIAILIQNPAITTLDNLTKYSKIINELPTEIVNSEITVAKARELGLPI